MTAPHIGLHGLSYQFVIHKAYLMTCLRKALIRGSMELGGAKCKAHLLRGSVVEASSVNHHDACTNRRKQGGRARPEQRVHEYLCPGEGRPEACYRHGIDFLIAETSCESFVVGLRLYVAQVLARPRRIPFDR